MSFHLRLAAVVTAIVVVVHAAPAAAREPATRSLSTPAAEVQDVLQAEAGGLVTVRYVPNDSRSAQIIVTNVSGKPLTLRRPTAFAGVPVLAQMMGMGGGGGGAGFGAGGIGGGAQTTGGGGLGQQGMNGLGGGMGGNMGGGGAFSIPPQKTRVLRVATVCLEHGKPEPSPRYPYKLAELDSFSTDPALAVVLERLGRGELPQKVAQAAAWHISNGMTWERLAAERIDHAGGVPDEPYFAPVELLAARRVVDDAARVVAALPAGGGTESASAQ